MPYLYNLTLTYIFRISLPQTLDSGHTGFYSFPQIRVLYALCLYPGPLICLLSTSWLFLPNSVTSSLKPSLHLLEVCSLSMLAPPPPFLFKYLPHTRLGNWGTCLILFLSAWTLFSDSQLNKKYLLN